jgi:hypothetical protein
MNVFRTVGFCHFLNDGLVQYSLKLPYLISWPFNSVSSCYMHMLYCPAAAECDTREQCGDYCG